MTSLNSFHHPIPAMRIHYGCDCLLQLASDLARAGCRRAMVFCGRSLANDTNGLPRLIALLGDLYAGSFQNVQAHSPLPAVVEGAEALRAGKADAVIALGGGSAIVSARASTILLGEGKAIEHLQTRFAPGQKPVSPRLLAPKLPQFVIPTTPTTACVKAGTAVLDPTQGKRLTMLDPQTRASALYLDPQLALAAPMPIVQDAALNAFVMAVQGLESNTCEPLADAQLIHALRLIRDNIPLLGTARDSADVRGKLLLAGVLIGQGTDYTSGGLASVIGHCLGTRQHLSNGLTNAILLPHTIHFNAPATGDRLMIIAELFGNGIPSGEDIAMAAAHACAAFFKSLGIATRLRDIGVKADALKTVTEDAKTDWFLYQNPRRIEDTDALLPVLQAAW
ncbi:MAG: iron-containing alcohol dehydrogenase family protein [Phyllobacterium sp.]